MRALLLAVFWTTLVVIVSTAAPSGAQGPLSYPYCALDTASGATSCYYSSREQCGARCIPNPSYRGLEGATTRGEGGRYRARR